MKRGIGVILVGVLALALVVSTQGEAQACSCINPQDPADQARQFEVIFGGYLKGEAANHAIFSVDAVYKGGLRPGTDALVGGMNDTCGTGHYTEGAYYTAFLQRSKAPYAAWHYLILPGCNPMIIGVENFDRDLYGLPEPERVPIREVVAARPPVSIAVESSWPWPWYLGLGIGLGAVILLGAGAVLAFRKRAQ